MYGDFEIEEKRIRELRMSDDPTSVGKSYKECGDSLISTFLSNQNLELSLLYDPPIWLVGIPFIKGTIPQLVAYVQRGLIKKGLLVVTYPVVEFPDLTDSYNAIIKDIKMKVVPI